MMAVNQNYLMDAHLLSLIKRRPKGYVELLGLCDEEQKRRLEHHLVHGYQKGLDYRGSILDHLELILTREVRFGSPEIIPEEEDESCPAQLTPFDRAKLFAR